VIIEGPSESSDEDETDMGLIPGNNKNSMNEKLRCVL